MPLPSIITATPGSYPDIAMNSNKIVFTEEYIY